MMVNNWMVITDFILIVTQPIWLYSSSQLCNYLHLHIFFSTNSVSSERFLLNLVILSYFFSCTIYFIISLSFGPYDLILHLWIIFFQRRFKYSSTMNSLLYLMLLNHCCFIFQLFHYPLDISLIFQNLNSTFVSEGEQNIPPKKVPLWHIEHF